MLDARWQHFWDGLIGAQDIISTAEEGSNWKPEPGKPGIVSRKGALERAN